VTVQDAISAESRGERGRVVADTWACSALQARHEGGVFPGGLNKKLKKKERRHLEEAE